MRSDGGDATATLARFEAVGIDIDALAASLQSDGTEQFAKSWDDLMERIDNQVALVKA